MNELVMYRRRRLAILAAAFVVINEPRPRRWWQRQLLQRRYEYSGEDLRTDLTAGCLFTNFTRVSNADFEILTNMIGPMVSKENTNFRLAISVNDRLAITLRYLATGDSYHSLMYLFKVSKQSISQIVPQVCTALLNCLSDYVKTPSNPEEWKVIATGFKRSWQFDQCIGALDGKHVVIQSPENSGSMFFNYKGQHSIVLMALVDSNYLFIYVNVGCQGRISDGGVFKNCDLWKLVENGTGLPVDQPLTGRIFAVPHVIVADDAFALHKHIMKPFPGHQEKGSKKRIFNYRLSRARRCSENAFGIVSSVFTVLRKPMLLSPEKTTLVTCTCIYLHNFLRKSTSSVNVYTPPGTLDSVDPEGRIIPGEWRKENQGLKSFNPLPRIGRKTSDYAKSVREEYATYFVSDIGSVAWQNEYS